MRFKERSFEKEYLDNKEIDTNDLYRNLIELDIINRFLGGYRASISGFGMLLNMRPFLGGFLDIGFGGGDTIKQLAKFAGEKQKDLFFYGVDIKSDCLSYATDNLKELKNKILICHDYRTMSADLLARIDVIHCSLFIHHLSNEEVVDLFKFAKTNKCMLLVNDLHRHWLAYYSIKLLTALFSKSWLVKNDAPLSVKRGFKKKELISLLQKAGFTNYSVTWSWAFRYIVIGID